MKLLTNALRDRLLANGRHPEGDHIPVVKFFNPVGCGTWLATFLHPCGDVLFGLADLGCPELGSFRLSDLEAVRLPLGFGIERESGKNSTSLCRSPLRTVHASFLAHGSSLFEAPFDRSHQFTVPGFAMDLPMAVGMQQH